MVNEVGGEPWGLDQISLEVLKKILGEFFSSTPTLVAGRIIWYLCWQEVGGTWWKVEVDALDTTVFNKHMRNILFLSVDPTFLKDLPLNNWWFIEFVPWDQIGFSAHRHFAVLVLFCPFYMWDFLKHLFKTNAGAQKEGSRENPIQG